MVRVVEETFNVRCEKCRRLLEFTMSDIYGGLNEWSDSSTSVEKNYPHIICPKCGSNVFVDFEE